MYKGLKYANDYLYNNLKVSKIKAGILPWNRRSGKLVEKLFFIHSGNKQQLEINGKLETLEVFVLTL